MNSSKKDSYISIQTQGPKHSTKGKGSNHRDAFSIWSMSRHFLFPHKHCHPQANQNPWQCPISKLKRSSLPNESGSIHVKMRNLFLQRPANWQMDSKLQCTENKKGCPLVLVLLLLPFQPIKNSNFYSKNFASSKSVSTSDESSAAVVIIETTLYCSLDRLL